MMRRRFNPAGRGGFKGRRYHLMTAHLAPARETAGPGIGAVFSNPGRRWADGLAGCVAGRAGATAILPDSDLNFSGSCRNRTVAAKGYSSVGRATVSKTVGRGFEPCCPCHRPPEFNRNRAWFFVSRSSFGPGRCDSQQTGRATACRRAGAPAIPDSETVFRHSGECFHDRGKNMARTGSTTSRRDFCHVFATIEPQKYRGPGEADRASVPGTCVGALNRSARSDMTRSAHVSKINPHLPHQSTEIAGVPPLDACDDDTARRNAERIIRQLLSDLDGSSRACPGPPGS